MTWKKLIMILMQMPMCELQKPITLKLPDETEVELSLKQENGTINKLNWRSAAGVQNLHFVIEESDTE